jgi:hypothetical protein
MFELLRGNAIFPENVCGLDDDGEDIGEPLLVAFNFLIVVLLPIDVVFKVSVVGGVSV